MCEAFEVFLEQTAINRNKYKLGVGISGDIKHNSRDGTVPFYLRYTRVPANFSLMKKIA